MSIFQPDPNRVNRVVGTDGVESQQRILAKAKVIYKTLANLLPSNYTSTIQGPNYTNEVKAVAIELAKMELALDDIASDQSYQDVRTDFLYSVVGYLVFLNGRLPQTTFDDVEFKRFLLSVIKIYFRGSIPDAMREAVGLFLSEGVTITENFVLVRKGASGYDISDEFGFQVDLDLPGGVFPPDIFDADSNIRLILDVLRPAHTLFRIRFILHDTVNPNGGAGVLDAMRWKMASYYYEDFRRYWGAVRDRNRLGQKVNIPVTEEDHSDDF